MKTIRESVCVRCDSRQRSSAWARNRKPHDLEQAFPIFQNAKESKTPWNKRTTANHFQMLFERGHWLMSWWVCIWIEFAVQVHRTQNKYGARAVYLSAVEKCRVIGKIAMKNRTKPNKFIDFIKCLFILSFFCLAFSPNTFALICTPSNMNRAKAEVINEQITFIRAQMLLTFFGIVTYTRTHTHAE